MAKRRTVLGMLGAAGLGATVLSKPAVAARNTDLAAAIAAITTRPEFAAARWGMAITRADTGEIVHAQRPDELFTAASSLKVFIAGTAFAALGPDHRFRTRIHRTGPVVRGVLHGDLVLVAGGDLLLSGRQRPDGTLLLPDPDPTYPGGAPLPDPFREIRALSARVRAVGVRRVAGRILVDASLFAAAREGIAMGDRQVTVSPMMVNDHVVHAVVTPGPAVGAPGVVRAVPATGHVRFVSEVRTAQASSGPLRPLVFSGDGVSTDGSRTVTVSGDIAVDGPPQYVAYFVPDPPLFAGTVLAEALRVDGVTISGGVGTAPAGWRGERVAEHVSLPLSEQVKVMLKVSSNVHTVTFPYVVGALAGDRVTPKAAFERRTRQLFRASGVDPDAAATADGTYTATTFTRFLTHLRRQPYYARYRDALPIMGRDGTLVGNQPGSPAAGHVYAKTGTGALATPAGGAVLHKALAGYIELPGHRTLAFAQFMRQETTREDLRALGDRAQEAMAEIAAAVYEAGSAR